MLKGVVGVVCVSAGSRPSEIRHIMFTCGSSGNVATELENFYVALHTDVEQHSLHCLAHLNTGLIVIDPERSGETIGITGLGKQFLRLFRVVLWNTGRVVAENCRSDDRVGGLATACVDSVDDGLAVDCHGQSLTNERVIERFFVHIHGNIPAGERRNFINRQLIIVIDFGDVIDRQIIGQINFAGFQSDRTLRRFRDDLHNQVFRCGLTGVIVIKCLECDMIALFPFDKAIRTGANGVQNEGVLICFNNSFGNDRRKGNCKVAEGR